MTNPDKNKFLIWKRSKNKRGYGTIQISGKTCLVHRVIYHLVRGPLFNRQLVCHHCDNPSCWNPNHLFVGTQQMNIDDMHKKGRQHPQDKENNGNHKLSQITVKAIRDFYKTGEWSQRLLARKFGVTQAAIWCVLKNRSWRNYANAS